ncbi:transglycosylase SLT domain-containing protein [Aestuariibius sp. 2305UL40-4]|uniref:transglycosylase SLT domain-containing protein n=1 Tax=Aestuariibius violaceus TaxID=3234132 RepID=UPI00398F249A
MPLPVLLAVALTETGRTQDGRFAPWPWTVNTGDRGHWFSTRAEAASFANRTLAEGQQSFDTGCFQINYRWHGRHFTSIDEMFDPARNAAYAARFLRDLYVETGSWSKAAGAYHSRTDRIANAYRARFDSHYARLAQRVDEPPPSPVRPQRTNTFPLLRGGGRPASPGSLFHIGRDRG